MKRERKTTGSIVGRRIPKYTKWKSGFELDEDHARGNKKQQKYIRQNKFHQQLKKKT